MLEINHVEIIKNSRLFGRAGDACLKRVLGAAAIIDVEKDTPIVRKGDPATFFYLVLSGWVKVYRSRPDGEEAILGVFGPSETFAEAAMFLGRAYPADADAVERCRLCRFSSDVVRSLMMEDPDLCFGMLGSVSAHLHQAIADLERLKTRNGPQRVAGFLLDFCDSASDRGTVHLPYDKSLIAARLGMRPESFSRSLRDLKKIGVRAENHVVAIDSIAALRDFYDNAPLRRS